jgi:hypothetical protein
MTRRNELFEQAGNMCYSDGRDEIVMAKMYFVRTEETMETMRRRCARGGIYLFRVGVRLRAVALDVCLTIDVVAMRKNR